MKILISTGIYPPKIGGPAQYSRNLRETLEKQGNVVKIATFSIENYLPTGVRHLWFFVKIIPKVLWADFIIVMDTFSVGAPTVLSAKIFCKKSIIRTGGDFLWESYVERTKKKVLLRNFYEEETRNFSSKDKLVFKITRWTLKNVSVLVFSTIWQRDIFIRAYGLDGSKIKIIENYYGQKEVDVKAESKVFVGSSRKLVLKNQDILEEVFHNIESAELFLENLPYEFFEQKIRSSYAVIQVSLGDISPNLILDAIRYNKPFICTKEVGIYDRIKDIGLFVDPLDKESIKKSIIYLLDDNNYREAKSKVEQFNFIHTWGQIANEFVDVYNSIK